MLGYYPAIADFFPFLRQAPSTMTCIIDNLIAVDNGNNDKIGSSR